ncbi:MAG: putative cytokinetic ring protein SteA [Actinomycetota bacterium]
MTSGEAIRTSTSRSRSLLRPLRKPRSTAGAARVGGRTKDLLTRIQPGEIAVIDHEDLDRVSAEGLVNAGVAAVINASRSISGRYPNLGPLILVDAEIPLIDGVGPLLLEKVREGEVLRLDGDRVYVGDRLLAVGVRQSGASVARSMEEARLSLGERFERFARNTVDYMQRERDLLFGGTGLPDIAHEMSDRPVLVVVRGYGYREDLAALRPYIRDVRPVLLGVDGGADALLEAGYAPDLIVGDMDSVSDHALELANGERRRRRRQATELVVHAYPGGEAPGHARLDRLGLPYTTVEATGTSEDLAFLMAHEKGADLIVAVGSHGNLREFLDKGRQGMASTFLVRLRVGEILMDAKGVSRLYSGRIRGRDTALLVGSAIFAMAMVVLVSPPLRLYVVQLFDEFRQWLLHLKELL